MKEGSSKVRIYGEIARRRNGKGRGEPKSIIRLPILLGNSTVYIEKTGGEVDNPDKDRNDRE